jgi:Domain of unknown function (DUF397)
MEGISAADRRESTRSGGNGADCVEVAAATAGIAVRDTTDRAGAVLTIPPAAWRTLLTGLRG